MLTTPIESLKKYVDQPSGSHDPEDVKKAAESSHCYKINILCYIFIIDCMKLLMYIV